MTTSGPGNSRDDHEESDATLAGQSADAREPGDAGPSEPGRSREGVPWGAGEGTPRDTSDQGPADPPPPEQPEGGEPGGGEPGDDQPGHDDEHGGSPFGEPASDDSGASGSGPTGFGRSDFDSRRGGPGMRWSGDGRLAGGPVAPEPEPATPGPFEPPPYRSETPRAPVVLDDPNAEAVDWPNLGRRPYASFGRRAGAFAIDLILKAILLEIVFAVSGVATVTDPLAPQLAIISQTLNLVYNWIFYRHGWTPGARILRIRIIRADGEVPGDRAALVRALGGLVSDLAFFIGYFWMLRDKHRQTWHDKMAGTYVVMAEDEDYDAWKGSR